MLELACGTGSVLAHLRGDYEVTGVDRSRPMLELAAAKLPGVELVHGDMTEVRLGRRFDAVLCLYDSINHVVRFEDWERTFDTAVAHLQPRGIFVFDMNSEERLDWFVGRPAVALEFGDANVVVIDVVDGGGRVRNWVLSVFEHVGGDDYRLARETIAEVSFPAEQVRASLERRFRAVEERDESGRLWFACREPIAAVASPAPA